MKERNKGNKFLYFHKISISCCQPIQELKNIIQHEEIKIRPISPQNNELLKYKSSIELVAPSDECLNYLASMENSIIRGCKVSYVELARDTRCDSFFKAESSLHRHARTLRKKYSGGLTYDGSYKEKNRGKGLIGDYTFYYGTVTGKEKTDNEITINITGRFKFAMYAKISPPIDGLAYAHQEWRILNAGNISKRTGIKTIKDLLTINKAELFEKLEKKYLTHNTINRRKLGLFLEGVSGCKKPSRYLNMRSQLHASMFRSRHKINTANDLVSYFMKEKKRIKSKVGRRNKWENKILSLNYSMVIDAVEPL